MIRIRVTLLKEKYKNYIWKECKFSYSYLNLYHEQVYSKLKDNKIYYNDSKIVSIKNNNIKLILEGQNMKYNVIDIVINKITDTKLKKIINKKLYNIIELLEFNTNPID